MNQAITSGNNFRDPFLFENVINAIGDKSDISLDLGGVSFIEPYSMIGLLLLGRNQIRNSGNKISLNNVPLQIHQYLSRMDFLSTGIFDVTDEVNEKMLLKRSSFSKSVLEIIEIPGKEKQSIKIINDIIHTFRSRAKFILKYWFNATIVDYFITVISELCQNIFEHSLDSGYLVMQSYQMSNEKVVRLVIADSGVGIPNSFKKENKYDFASDSEYIKNALLRPISSKRDFGYGLCQVNSIMEKLQGTIYIRSQRSSLTAMYKKAGGDPYFFVKDNLREFQGTQISLTLVK